MELTIGSWMERINILLHHGVMKAFVGEHNAQCEYSFECLSDEMEKEMGGEMSP